MQMLYRYCVWEISFVIQAPLSLDVPVALVYTSVPQQLIWYTCMYLYNFDIVQCHLCDPQRADNPYWPNISAEDRAKDESAHLPPP